mgnify:CR=1 FL=1
MKWMDRERSFWVIGGDLRQRALARLLREDGHTVHIAGLEGEGLEPEPLGPGLALAHRRNAPLHDDRRRVPEPGRGRSHRGKDRSAPLHPPRRPALRGLGRGAVCAGDALNPFAETAQAPPVFRRGSLFFASFPNFQAEFHQIRFRVTGGAVIDQILFV